MRDYVVAQDDTASIATLDTIDEHLAAARKHHATAQSLAAEPPAARGQTRESVRALQDSLEEVRQSQQSILERYELTPQPAAVE